MQEEYRDRNIVDGCAFMFKGCDKLNELAHYYNIYKNDVKVPGHSVYDMYA